MYVRIHTYGMPQKGSIAYITLLYTNTRLILNLLLSMYLIVGIGEKSYGFQKILHFKNQPCNRLYQKNQLECIGKAAMMLCLG